jgi:formate-dependent nitrite reductase membrane component NrfD
VTNALDGRYIDTAIATLDGEGAHQEIDLEGRTPPPSEAWHIVPSRAGAGLEPTYYDKPAIKPPDWSWAVPAYFFVGGAGGAAMTMAFASQVIAGKKLRRFDEHCRWIGAVCGGLGSALLVYDLGRPMRFLAMLRVFRPTSPMSLGSWVLAGATPLSAGSALFTMSRGRLREASHAMGIGAGLLGMPLATYTAVLISTSAVPVWAGSRRSLPLLFGASSMATLGAIYDLLPMDRAERRITDRFGLAGRIAELAAGVAVEREAAKVPRVARPLQRGVSGALWKASKALTLASVAVSLLPVKRPARRIASGTLGFLGSFALRWAIFQAGRASALDPRASFALQRAGLAGAEATGRPAVADPPRAVPQMQRYEDFIKV